MLLKFTLSLFLLSYTLLADSLVSRTQVMMGTFITLSTPEQQSSQIQKGFDIISNVDMSLSSYKKEALVYKLNHHKEVILDENLYKALQLSKTYYKNTNGYFDISVGSITKNLYKFGEEERVPNEAKLKNAKIKFNGLTFNDKKAFLEPNVTIDLGGMGKGFAVDKVAAYFQKNNVTHAIIAASGDIRCLSECHINVQNPFSEDYLADFDTVKNEQAISTSGNYNRFVKSVKNNHLINPKRKHSAQNFISITLLSTLSNSELDAYATATSVMPKQEAYDFLDSKSIAYIIVEDNKKVVVSKNIKSFAKNIRYLYKR